MKLYFAPMEGITAYTYRNTHAEIFGGCDRYFAPFIVPSESERISRKTLRDIIKDNNSVDLCPQVLCNSAEAFINFANRIRYAGFNEVNLNLGCPSGTVVKKGRGAGTLKDTEALDRFFDKVFSETNIKISVKTRAGYLSHDEFDDILKVYNKYPVDELIIHPRVREEFYSGVPNMDTFDKAYNGSELKLCYNGNIYTKEDFEKIEAKYPKLSSVMIGREQLQILRFSEKLKVGNSLKQVSL